MLVQEKSALVPRLDALREGLPAAAAGVVVLPESAAAVPPLLSVLVISRAAAKQVALEIAPTMAEKTLKVTQSVAETPTDFAAGLSPKVA